MSGRWQREDEWFGGAVLMTAGALTALLSGGCVWTALTSSGEGFIVPSVCTMIGMAMFVFGVTRMMGAGDE